MTHIKVADQRLNTDWIWLADAMDNQVKNAFGNRNNSEFIVDPDGKIVRARTWSDEEALRKDLEGYVGKVEKRTTIADLGRKPYRSGTVSHSSGLPKVDAPSGAKTVMVTAAKSEEPFYAKLRADADSALIQSGTGKIRIGFHIDPIHQVHWNNLAPPLKFRFLKDDDSSATFSPAEVSAPKVEPESDTSPREFLIEIQDADRSKPIEVEVSYFPCHDVEKWCKAVTQVFSITLREDRHAGKVRAFGGEKGRGKGMPKGGERSPEMMFSRMDSNKDGVIRISESRGPMIQKFDQIDADEDGAITMDELKTYFKKR